MHYYFSAGMRIASEIALPSLRVLEPFEDADLAVAIGEIDPAVFDAKPIYRGRYKTDDALYLNVETVGRFHIADGGRRVVIAPKPGCERQAAAFIAGSVLGAALHMQDRVVLHASAILIDGQAVVFCGPSGAGKSTTAAIFNQHGYPICCDDVCAIEIIEGRAFLRSDGRFIKLWQASIDGLDLETARGANVIPNHEKFFLDIGDSLVGAVPIAAIYELNVPDDPDVTTAMIDTMPSAAAIATLMSNAYRPWLVRALDARPLYFQVVSALLGQSSVRRLSRPLNFDRTDALVQVIVDDLAGNRVQKAV